MKKVDRDQPRYRDRRELIERAGERVRDSFRDSPRPLNPDEDISWNNTSDFPNQDRNYGL